jgi:hypothetical protein
MFDTPVVAADEQQLLGSIRRKADHRTPRETLDILTPDELYYLADQSRVLRDTRRSQRRRFDKPHNAPELNWWQRIVHSCERVSRAGGTRHWRPASLGQLYNIPVRDTTTGYSTETCICGRTRLLSSDPAILPTRWRKPEKWPMRCTRDHLYVMRTMALNDLCAGQPWWRQLTITTGLIVTRWKRYPGLTTARLHSRRRHHRARRRQLGQSGRP